MCFKSISGLAITLGLLMFSFHPKALAKSYAFDIKQLPHGKNVTLPRPATTIVPIPSRITLTSNDSPQSVSFKPVNSNGGDAPRILLKIFDRHRSRVQNLELRAKAAVIYKFHGLSSILVIPELHPSEKRGLNSAFKIQFQSDKPLTIAH